MAPASASDGLTASKMTGTPTAKTVLQKLVDHYDKDSADVPAALLGAHPADDRYVADMPYAMPVDSQIRTAVTDEDGIHWIGTDRGLIRIDKEARYHRDRVQYFISGRYLPDDKVVSLLPDGNKGVWALTATGVSHVKMVPMTLDKKAFVMSDHTQRHVSRRGMVSDARWNGSSWMPSASDNDGLWTSMYAAGESFRYATLLRELRTPSEELEKVRKIATRSVEAVLLLANVSGRDEVIDARIRHSAPHSNEMSREYLAEGKPYELLLSSDGPAGFVNVRFAGADYRWPGTPANPADWVTSGPARTRKRNLAGFVARSYMLVGLATEPLPSADGWFYRKKLDANGKTISVALPENPLDVERKDSKGDYVWRKVKQRADKWENFAGVTTSSGLAVHDRLARLYRDFEGGHFSDTDVIYKGDTSTDELVGHTFVYQIAYETLVEQGGDKELGELIACTMERLAQHMVDNDYALVDITGQPTTWCKVSREYFLNAFSWEDSPLNSLVLLTIMKVAAYVTGDAKWEREYRKLAIERPYRYATLAGEYLERWQRMLAHRNGLTYEEHEPSERSRLDFLMQEHLNYSDEEMAMLAYYTLFRLERDPKILALLRKGLDNWWESGRYQSHPLWNYVYQLGNRDRRGIKDGHSDDILDVAAWALKRHPIDQRVWHTNNAERKDIKISSPRRFKSMKPGADGWFFALPMDERSLKKYNSDPFHLHSHGDGTLMEPCTTYTLPYWMGRYYKFIRP